MSTNDRFHSLDVVRASALLAGIVLHAIMSFLPGFREVNWPLSDTSTSAGLGVLYFVIHIFRMSLFFIIAGFFAHLLHQRLGTRGFLKNRFKRIGLPLVAFYLLVMPLTVVAIIWGARQLGIKGAPIMKLPIPVIGPPVPWGHLWFLYLLLVIYIFTLSVRAIVARLDSNNILRGFSERLFTFSMETRSAPVLFSIPLVISLFLSPWWVQWQGIPAPIIGLIPNLPGFLAYAGSFFVGWFLYKQQECLGSLARDWILYLAGASVCAFIALSIAGIAPKFEVIELNNTERAIYAAAYIIAQWCAAFAVIGFAVRYLQAPNARWRYLADASYWMYLIHLPIIWLLQAWMLQWPLPWPIKLVLILTITSVFLLATYHYFVRATFLGNFLNGRKYPRIQSTHS